MSIKWRMTVWFTGMMLLMVALVLVFVFIVNKYSVTGDAKSRLIDVVEDNAEDLEFENGGFNWKRFDFYSHGVYCIACDKDGRILRGTLPFDYSGDLPFEVGAVRTISVGSDNYYVYDVYIDLELSGMWIRGVINSADSSGIAHVLTVLASSLLPSILAFSIAGGWLLGWGSFRPLTRINNAAESIVDGDDLSARINMKHGAREIRKLSQTFDAMFDRLEQSFIAQKQFTSDASHELRTPLTVILSECDRSHRKDTTPEDYQKTITSIENQAEKMSGLIDSLLDLTRLQQGTDRYPMSVCNLSAAVTDICEEFVPAQRRGISLKTDIEPDVNVRCNLRLMASCLQNLLQNAYKYGKENGHIRVSLSSHSDRVELKVNDDGIGISKEDQARIWQRFWQADTSRSVDYGSGLGLSYVHDIAQLHGGTASVSSTLGVGSTFTVTIPLNS